MNGSRSSATELVQALLAGVAAAGHAEIVLCPPSIFIPTVAEQLTGTDVKLGGQNLDSHDPGAYTGEIAAGMLKDYDCEYCIVGHSERRALYGETDQVVAEKFAKAQSAGLKPILCVGETLQQRQSDQTEAVLARQLDAVIDYCGIDGFGDAVLAYEPVWAIGTGKTATPEQAQAVHAFLRKKLSLIDAAVAQGLRIQYGGSVKPDNADKLFNQQDIDGGLIGGAALKAEDFLAICRAA